MSQRNMVGDGNGFVKEAWVVRRERGIGFCFALVCSGSLWKVCWLDALIRPSGTFSRGEKGLLLHGDEFLGGGMGLKGGVLIGEGEGEF